MYVQLNCFLLFPIKNMLLKKQPPPTDLRSDSTATFPICSWAPPPECVRLMGFGADTNQPV